MKRCTFTLYGLLCCALLWLASCKTTSTISRTDISSDSVSTLRYVERIVKDTILVQVPSESRSVVVASDTSELRTSFAISVASVDSLGFLHHTLENIVNTLPVVTDSKVITRDSIVYRDRVIKDYKSFSRKGVSPWALIGIGFFLALLSIGVIFVTTRK